MKVQSVVINMFSKIMRFSRVYIPKLAPNCTFLLGDFFFWQHCGAEVQGALPFEVQELGVPQCVYFRDRGQATKITGRLSVLLASSAMKWIIWMWRMCVDSDPKTSKSLRWQELWWFVWLSWPLHADLTFPRSPSNLVHHYQTLVGDHLRLMFVCFPHFLLWKNIHALPFTISRPFPSIHVNPNKSPRRRHFRRQSLMKWCWSISLRYVAVLRVVLEPGTVGTIILWNSDCNAVPFAPDVIAGLVSSTCEKISFESKF